MSWKEKVFASFKLYAVTDLESEDPAIFEKINQAYAGGADIVQLRSKKLSDAALYRMGKKIKELAEAQQKLFFVNDRPDLALALEADGVHLGQDDLSVDVVRKMIAQAGRKLWIGKSTHNLEQGKAAVQEKPDYIGVGPVYATPTKPGYTPAGLEYVRQAAEQFCIPFVAIGGINLQNLTPVLEAGAKRIAVVRAIFTAPDPATAASQFKKQIESFHYVTR